MQKFNFLLPSFAILCTFYFSSCEGEVEFIDLNKNGKLDIYENPQLSASQRTEDLISYLFSGLATFVTIYSYYDYRRDKLSGDFNPIDLKLRVLAPLSYILSSSVIGVLIYLSK